MIRLFYSPEVSVSAGGELVSDTKVKKSKGYTPGADDDFKAVCERVCAAWKNNPGFVLIWTSQEEMQQLFNTYASDLAERKVAGSDRPSITSTLELLNADMNAAVTEVKVYIEKKFKKKKASPQFPRYGIVKSYGAYILPRDNNKRFEHLDLMLAAIAKDGFDKEEYGTAYWTDMKKRFGDALANASSTDGTVSGKVSGKNTARQQLVKIMTSLRGLLMANYPETYQSVFREWGWQKQDY